MQVTAHLLTHAQLGDRAVLPLAQQFALHQAPSGLLPS